MEIKDVLALSISVASFLWSAYTFFVVRFDRGRLRMTQPTLLSLKRDLPKGWAKIFLRTCLFTTGTKGRVVENMFLRVRRNNAAPSTFDFWGHTESGKLTLGSGLFVGPTGVASDHHFNPREGSADFLFASGEYVVEVFATVVGHRKSEKLMQLAFAVGDQQAAELLQNPTRELRLYWNADSHAYHGHIVQDDPVDPKLIQKLVEDVLRNYRF